MPLTSQLNKFSNSEAYAVAALIHEMRIKEGAVPVGRKIGFTNPKMWTIYSVCEPIWGYIYDTTVVQLTGSKARCSIGQFAEPKIEPVNALTNVSSGRLEGESKNAFMTDIAETP
jgi:2-oxo-3-hexenedioate decarboxylase